MGIVAAAATVLTTVISGSAQVAQGVSAERKSRRARREAEAEQGRVTAEAYKAESQAQMEAGRIAARRSQQMRRALAGSTSGRQGTILTGPLGLPPTGQEAGGKMLLGQ